MSIISAANYLISSSVFAEFRSELTKKSISTEKSMDPRCCNSPMPKKGLEIQYKLLLELESRPAF